MKYHAGQHVLISSAERGTSAGEIVEVSNPQLLPDLPAVGIEASRISQLLAELEVTQLLFITYRPHPEAAVRIFAALVDRAGEIRDLRKQKLTLRLIPDPRNN